MEEIKNLKNIGRKIRPKESQQKLGELIRPKEKDMKGECTGGGAAEGCQEAEAWGSGDV